MPRSVAAFQAAVRGHPPNDFFPAAGFLQYRGVTSWGEGRLAMAKVIEFYIPKNFSNCVRRLAGGERGRVIEFSLPKKSA